MGRWKLKQKCKVVTGHIYIKKTRIIAVFDSEQSVDLEKYARILNKNQDTFFKLQKRRNKNYLIQIKEAYYEQ
jgi:hypothetical protein